VGKKNRSGKVAIPSTKNEKRIVLASALRVLHAHARRAEFRRTYARNTPSADIDKNVFYFRQGAIAPRAVLFGYSVYFVAPQQRPEHFLHLLDKAFRTKAHLGNLHYRLPLTDRRAVSALEKFCKKLRGS